VALAQSVPLGYSSAQRQIAIDDDPLSERARLTVWMNTVGPGYFGLMHLRIIAGRGFDDRDTAASPAVAVVNEELAKLLHGSRMYMKGRMLQVIGVAQTAKYFQLNESPRLYFYLPYSQNYASRMVLHVETDGAPAGAAGAVLGEVRRLDPEQPVSEVRVLDAYVTEGAVFAPRIGMQVVGAVGLCGLMLALVGLYGVVSAAVARRRREISVRLALGATRSRIISQLLSGVFCWPSWADWLERCSPSGWTSTCCDSSRKEAPRWQSTHRLTCVFSASLYSSPLSPA